MDGIRDPLDVSGFVGLPSRKAEGQGTIVETPTELPVTVADIPDLTVGLTSTAGVDALADLPAVLVGATPIQGWHAVAKRAVDIVGSLVLLVVLGLPLLVLALLVKMSSPGPALLRQQRLTLAGRPFTMLKFRSMRADAESGTGPVWAQRDDPRRTCLGAFMRRLSLDELPQLFNVLRGEMSLVGPRPERPRLVRRFAQEMPAYMLRHVVKAGLTGWAQVNGLRGRTSLEKRLEYDLYYIDNWSMGFDLFILLLTPLAVLFSKNAC